MSTQVDEVLHAIALDYAKQFDTRIQDRIKELAKEAIHRGLSNTDSSMNDSKVTISWHVRQKYLKLFLITLQQEIDAVDPDAYVGSTLTHSTVQVRVPGYEDIPAPRNDAIQTYATKGTNNARN